MRVLFIAPQPFFENRGTPIAIRDLLRVLGDLGHKTDLVTYYAGQDLSIPGTMIHRCARLPFKTIPIGFSLVKLLLDPLLYFVVLERLVRRRYDVIHCVEEGVYLGLAAFPRRGALLCYDMDSSLVEQLVSRGGCWRLFSFVLRHLERWATRRSSCVVSVCPALTEYVKKAGQRRVFQIEDAPVVHPQALSGESEKELRKRLSLGDRRVVLYIGNFEAYQGVDLLLRGFTVAARERPDCSLLLVGGSGKEIRAKRSLVRSLGIEGQVAFAGFVPPEEAGIYLSLADIVVSPRIRGTNFPMKVYSYLVSGRPLIATDIPVHSQILDHDTALLVPPTAEGLAQGMLRLLANPELASSLTGRARQLGEREFSEEAFKKKVTELYRWMSAEVAAHRSEKT